MKKNNRKINSFQKKQDKGFKLTYKYELLVAEILETAEELDCLGLVDVDQKIRALEKKIKELEKTVKAMKECL